MPMPDRAVSNSETPLVGRAPRPHNEGMRFVALALLMILSAGPAHAQDQTTLRDDVRRLVEDLDADTRAVRTQAERSLRDLGPKVLPYLPSAELVGPGAKESLAKIRFELERRLARESLQGALVTIDGGRTVSDWLDHIANATTNRIDRSRIPAATLAQNISFAGKSERTFWDAMAALEEAARLRTSGRSTRGELILEPDAGVSSVLGAFRSQAFQSRLVGATLRDGLVAGEDLLRLTLELEAEPRLRCLFLKYSASELTAGDLKPLSPDGKYEVLLADGLRPARLQADFRRPSSESSTTLDVAGRFQVTVAAGSEAIRFTGLQPLTRPKPVPITRRRGGVTVSVQKVQANADEQELQVEVRVSYDSGGPAFESHRSWLLHNRAYLELPGGRTVELNGGLDPVDQSNGAISAVYTFRHFTGPVNETAFVYVAPTLIVETAVDVRFSGVEVAEKVRK